MKRLSSSESVWPALQKTWSELFNPFQWREFLKFSGVAVVAESILVCCRFVVTNELTAEVRIPLVVLRDWHYRPLVIWAGTTLFVLLAVFYYTAVRLRFVLFHCLVNRTRDLTQGWQSSGHVAMRMLGICILYWLLIPVFLVAEAIVLAICGLPVFTFRLDGQFDPGIILLMMIPATLSCALVLAWIAMIRIVLHDFILPQMALENLSFRQARQRFKEIRRKEKETFFWYLVLRLFLAVAPWAILAATATGLGYLLLWLLSATSTGYDLLLGDTGTFGTMMKWMLDWLFLLGGVAVSALLSIAFGGPLAVFTRNFALLFYAGRYPALGRAMDEHALPLPVAPVLAKAGSAPALATRSTSA